MVVYARGQGKMALPCSVDEVGKNEEVCNTDNICCHAIVLMWQKGGEQEFGISKNHMGYEHE